MKTNNPKKEINLVKRGESGFSGNENTVAPIMSMTVHAYISLSFGIRESGREI